MSFPLPYIFTAWGFRRSADAWNGAQFLADRCKAAGIKTVAVQLGMDDALGQPWTLLDEAETLRGNGLRVVVWGVAGADYTIQELARLKARPEDWFPQIEAADQRDKVYEAAAKGLKATAIVTNYGGASDREDIVKLRQIGVKDVHVECYGGEGYPFYKLDTMIWQGTQYGWREDELYCTVSTYRDEMPDLYTHPEKLAKGFGIYLSEPMSYKQWQAWGNYKPPPPPEPPKPPPLNIPDPGDVRVAASRAFHSWLDPYMTQNKPQTLSIIRLADRLVKLTPKQQVDFNEQLLVDELDRVGSPRT